MQECGGSLAAIVVNRNGGELVLRCLQSLVENSCPPQLILVVDNHSTDGSDLGIERQFPQAQLIRNSRNLGYAAALNLGIGEACRQGFDLLLMMNNDLVLDREAVEILVRHWHPRAGLLGPKVFRLGEAARLDAAWGKILFHHVVCRMVGENSPDSPRFSKPQSVDALLGCMLLTSCSVVGEVGPLDPDYFMYMEEIDYAYRVGRIGRQVLFVPEARVWHAGGHATSKEARQAVKRFYVRRNTVLFLRKHGTATHWCKFLLFAVASLLFCLMTLRWNELRLRLRGYLEGLRAPGRLQEVGKMRP
ncbi:MAG: glycosyltransferase family 2 protein [Acidobacteria bacterium]|nr:glycosyltransferase family 2 protein [Acidobacteriota bacterium]